MKFKRAILGALQKNGSNPTQLIGYCQEFNSSYYLAHPSKCFRTFYEWGFFKLSWFFWSRYVFTDLLT